MNRFIVLILAMLPVMAGAQFEALKIGEKLPSFTTENFLNWDKPSLSSAQMKGKMILLDFGATTCSPCLAAMPLLDSMQKQFNGKLQVLMITRENKEKVQRFMQKNKIAKGVSFPVITNDSLLNGWFPHSSLPHEVWINAEGFIVAMTDHHYITAAHIEKVIRMEKPDWPLKADALSAAEDKTIKPFLQLESVQYYTLYSKPISGYRTSSFFKADTVENKFYLRYINAPITSLYYTALKLGGLSFDSARIRVDSSLYDMLYFNGKGFRAEWEERNRHCFEILTFLPQQREKLSWKIIRELDDCLGIRTSVSKQRIKCLVLKRTDKNYQLTRRLPGVPQTSLGNVFTSLKAQKTHTLIDETGLLSGQRDSIFIKASNKELKDRNLLQEMLRQIGFCITEEERVMDVLEFKPAPKNQ